MSRGGVMVATAKRVDGQMANGEAGGGGDGGLAGVDENALASIIANSEDLGPVVRAAFELGKPEALLHQLRGFVKKKESEIEELCRLHYEEFIHAVDELRYVLKDAEQLKQGLTAQNVELQEAGMALLVKLEELVECHKSKRNLTEAIESLRKCRKVVELCVKVNGYLATDSYYPALKTLDIIEREHLRQIPARVLRIYVARQIPACRAHVERRVNKEFNDWLVNIRSSTREIGRLSIAQAGSQRQREEDLRGQQRQAEEQSRSGQRDCKYMLEVEEIDEDDEPLLKLDLTPVYRGHYIHQCLGKGDEFRDFYCKNRKLQLNTDLQFQQSQSFLENFQNYFAQVAGFFIVEDKVMRTAGGLITSAHVDNLWEVSTIKMKAVIEEQFAEIQTATTLLLVKDYVSLLCSTLRRYGYQVSTLLDVLDTTREKYFDLLMLDARGQINDILVNDKFEQMIMRKEFEYKMNVLAFRLQTSDNIPAFPYVAPFSAMVPECCRVVRNFVEISVSFLAHGANVDVYDMVRKYLDKLLMSVLNEAILRVIKNPNLGMAHAMQLAANMTVLETACSFFAEHAGKLCGVPARLIESGVGGLASRAVLRNSQTVAHDQMLGLFNSKINEVMLLAGGNSTNWLPDEPPASSSDYIQELHIYLETMMSTASDILPLDAYDKLSRGIMTYISESVVKTLCSDEVRRFNVYAIMGLDADLKVLEAFADERFRGSGMDRMPGTPSWRTCFAEARQLVQLLLSNTPEQYLDLSARERLYPNLNPEVVLTVCEKYKDATDISTATSKIGLSVGRVGRHTSKKRAYEALCKRLKEMIAEDKRAERRQQRLEDKKAREAAAAAAASAAAAAAAGVR